MKSLLYALKLAGVLLAMTTIVPLWVGFAARSLARAWAAWRGYLLIIGVIGGGGALFGVLAGFVDHISR